MFALQGIVPDAAGLEGLEAALHDALDAGADVLITSGADYSRNKPR